MNLINNKIYKSVICIALSTLTMSANLVYAKEAPLLIKKVEIKADKDGYVDIRKDTQKYDRLIALTKEKINVVPERILENINFDLYEVLLPEGKILYLTKNEKYLIDGAVVNLNNLKENITSVRTAKSLPYDEKALSYKDALKVVKGDGSRKIITFEDPNCGYCKKFHTEREKLDNVTIYTFMVPVLGEDSVSKAKSVWCSANKEQAWDNVMNNIKIENNTTCDTGAIDRNIQISKKFKVTGTPTFFLENGERVQGFENAQKIEERLSRIKQK